MRKRPLIGMIVGLCWLMIPSLVQAQDAPASVTPAPPTATDIPVLGSEDDNSAAPSLPGIQPQPTVAAETTPEPDAPETTAEPAPEATEASISVPVQSSCPTLVQEGFTAAQQVCDSLAAGEACIGNGSVNASANADAEITFNSPGDRIQLVNLQELRLQTSSTENNVWTVVTSRQQFFSTEGSASTVAQLILFGDLTLSDASEQTSSTGAQNATVIAQFGLNVRRTPGSDGVVVYQLTSGQEIIATGITADRQWIRIEIPSGFGGAGWVYAPYLQIEGGTEALPIVTANTPRPQLEAPDFGPMQAFNLLSAQTPADCGGNIPDSGMLVQSQSGLPSAMRFEVNDVELQLNGTVFIQAQAGAEQTIDVLEGDLTAIANDADVSASAGSRVTIPLNANLIPSGAPATSDFDASSATALPIRLLPRQFVLTADDDTTDSDATSLVAPGNPVECTLTAIDEERNIRGGPSLDYPVADILQPGETITATGRNEDDVNYTWYQTAQGWLRFDTVQTSGDCDSLPNVEAPPVPTITPTSPPESTANSVTSSTLGQICPGGSVSDSTTFNASGSTYTVTLGGTLTASGGSSITVQTQGGMLRPEIGDYIRIVAADGTLLAGSDDGRVIAYTFQQDRTFQLQFSGANGDVIVMQVTCGTPG